MPIHKEIVMADRGLEHVQAALLRIFAASRGPEQNLLLPAQQLYKEVYHAYNVLVQVPEVEPVGCYHAGMLPGTIGSPDSTLKAWVTCYSYFQAEFICFHANLRHSLCIWQISSWHTQRPDKMSLTHELWRVIFEEFLGVTPRPASEASTNLSDFWQSLQQENAQVAKASGIAINYLQKECDRIWAYWKRTEGVLPVNPPPWERLPLGEFLAQSFSQVWPQVAPRPDDRSPLSP